MRAAFQVLGVAICCLAIAAGAAAWLVGFDVWKSAPIAPPQTAPAQQQDASALPDAFPDPNAPGTNALIYVERSDLDYGIGSTAIAYMGTVHDHTSLDELRESQKGMGRRGIADLRAQYERLKIDSNATLKQVSSAILLARAIGLLYMFEGKFAEANEWLEQGLSLCRRPEISPDLAATFHSLLGIAALRRGETENCIDCMGPSSCIYPLDAAAVHRQQIGSRDAIKHFSSYLEWAPGDLRVRWLLNIAYMTVGEYPAKVPRSLLDPARRVRLQARCGTIRKRVAQSRPVCKRPEHGRRQYLR